jgi:hypothetical protein
VTWQSRAAWLSSASAREGACGVLTSGPSDVASGRAVEMTTGGGVVVVVEKKAVTCHGWDPFPDLGEAGPWAAGVGYYYIMFLTW